MGVYLADQTMSFIYACLLGAALGALYDVFRIMRIALPSPHGVIFVQDVVFFAVCAVATFLFMLTTTDGVVRVFLLIGELVGAVLYHCALGVLVIKISGAIIAAVRVVLGFIIRCIFTPLWHLVYYVVVLLLRPICFLYHFTIKTLQRFKFCLKVRRIVLYNHFKGYFTRKAPAKRKKGETRECKKREKKRKDHVKA